jgi:hypothetical protein
MTLRTAAVQEAKRTWTKKRKNRKEEDGKG